MDPATNPKPAGKSTNSGASTDAGTGPRSLTGEQIQRMELNRMKAKAQREQRECDLARGFTNVSDQQPLFAAGRKRPAESAFSIPSKVQVPVNQRDARTPTDRPGEPIRPVRNFAKYVDFDFSKMTDTKGGFLTAEDDPHNRAMRSGQLSLKEWERHQELKMGKDSESVKARISSEAQACRECRSLDTDEKWAKAFHVGICRACKDKYPEKYSLLTKTEVKEDYLLTDPELRDEELLPHLEKPNPHQSTWNNMMLYLRYQVESYAFSPKKWGSPEALDAEFERREALRKRQKESKFKSKLLELRKKTRSEAYRRSLRPGAGGGNFGDQIGGAKHVHTWGRLVPNTETGMGVKTCTECGMQVEELEL